MAVREDIEPSKPAGPSTATSSRVLDSSARFESIATTGTRGLTNARTRIVGDRTGFLADAVVAFVRATAVVRRTLSRAFGRVAGVITPLGWLVMLSVPLALVAGYVWGIAEVVVLGWVMLVLVAVAVLYLVGRIRVTVELSVPHSRVVVGEKAEGALTARNDGRGRSLGLTVEVPVGAGLAEVAVPGLARGAQSEQTFAIPSAR